MSFVYQLESRAGIYLPVGEGSEYFDCGPIAFVHSRYVMTQPLLFSHACRDQNTVGMYVLSSDITLVGRTFLSRII